MDKGKRRPQFQIRKVPLRRNPPQKSPQLYALDVHSICLPSRSRKAINWGSVHSENQYQQEINPQIIYSPVYQRLYSQFLALRQQHSQNKGVIQQEIQNINATVNKEEENKRRLQTLRDGLYGEIERLRENLNEVRDKNYNLRWEIYHQRGAHYMNVNGLSFAQAGQMTYEQLLQMEQQMGNVSKGLTEEEIALIPVSFYSSETSQEICCICFDQMQPKDQIFQIQCKHKHHKDCLRDWLRKQRVCPICKQEVIVAEQS